MRSVAVALSGASLVLFSWSAHATSLTKEQVQNVCGSAYHTTAGGAQGCSKPTGKKGMTYYYCDKTGSNCGAIVVAKGAPKSKLPPGVSELGSTTRSTR